MSIPSDRGSTLRRVCGGFVCRNQHRVPSGLRANVSLDHMLASRPLIRTGCWIAFRQTGIDPHQAVFWRPGSIRRPIPQESGRWHVRGQGYAQYLSLTREGAWAEFIRARELATESQARGTLRNLWRCWIRDSMIADLSTAELATGCGLSDPAMLIGPHRPCQQLASELIALGFRGVLAPSAALDATVNLTLFGPRDENHLMVNDRYDSREAHPDIIDVRLEQPGGQPPAELLARTRRRTCDPTQYANWPGPTAARPTC
jgi:hypothetical protein